MLVRAALLLGASLLALAAAHAGGALACGGGFGGFIPRVFTWRPPAPPVIRRPPPRPRPPPLTRPPPPPPTPRPTQNPTRSPTPQPTMSPTPSPTPPPPPPPFHGVVPTPPTESTPYMTRSDCQKRVEFTATGAPGEEEVSEAWIYTCSYKIYVTVALNTINRPTPCACGIAVGNPPPKNGVVESAYFTNVTEANLVIYDVRRNKVIRNLDEFKFRANQNTTALLRQGVAGGDGNFMQAIAGFSGVVDAFPNKPRELDNTVRGQEDNAAALCFTVVQRFRSKYQWPEPPTPTLHTPPAVYKSDCIPYFRENVFSYRRRRKRDTAQQARAEGATDLWFREFLVFANTDLTSGGFNPRSRYITSYYTNSVCAVVSGYVSFDRHFVSTLERPAESHGTFQWLREYTDVHIVGGVPSAIEQVSNFLASGYHRITWRQPYSVGDNGAFRPGVLAANLRGERHPDDPNSGNAQFRICDAVPALWKTCALGDAGCGRKEPSQLDNHPDTVMWPTARGAAAAADAAVDAELGKLRCLPAFQRCDVETTWLAFQNYGLAARDFSKTPKAHLLTGPRAEFCGIARDVRFDTLKFKPHTIGMEIRKRGVDHAAAAAAAAAAAGAHPEFTRKRGTQVLETLTDPIAEALPNARDAVLRPAVGSADAHGTAGSNAGDHPVSLFPEQYTATLSVREEDASCGETYALGTVDVTGCEAKRVAGAPPCLVGSLGCQCRTLAGRPPCDAPLSCTSAGFCVKPSCVEGALGCACTAAGTCDGAATVCGADKRCYVDDSACAAGGLGCPCTPSGGCNAGGVCSAGVCADGAAGCTPGAPGCKCDDAAACTAGAAAGGAFVCQAELGLCVTAAFCEPGAAGCKCARGSRCAAGFECVQGVDKCGEPRCPEGTPGCPCAADGSCSAKDHACVKLTVDGKSTACLAEVKCGDQSVRCNNYCGADNVLQCPACENEVPKCVSPPGNGATRAAAVAGVLLLAALLLAALA